MKTRTFMAAIVLLMVAFWVLPAVAQEDNRFTKARVDEIKNPVPWLHWGFDQRIREVYAENIITPNDDIDPIDRWHFGRYRSRLWSQFDLAEGVQLDTRLMWEWRYWDGPDRGVRDQNVNFDEVMFDHLNVKFSNAFGAPLDITVGRQDIILGNGWLVLDGTPMDGSRTIFFDAARFTYKLEDAQTNVDLIYLEMRPEADQTIKPFNDRNRVDGLTQQEERGVILNVANKSLVPNATLEGFFMWKNDVPDDDIALSNDGDIYTVGARIDGAFDDNWKYRGEGAIQLGDKNYQSICAQGANTRLSYCFNDSYATKLHCGYEYLSGDENSSGNRTEQFDPLWGRWPQWSELYVYTYASETRIGETTNLHRWFVGGEFQPCTPIKLSANYHLLFADETPMENTVAFNDGHKYRGQLANVNMGYKINDYWSGHLLGEFFIPGNYYERDYRDEAMFLRAELMLTF